MFGFAILTSTQKLKLIVINILALDHEYFMSCLSYLRTFVGVH